MKTKLLLIGLLLTASLTGFSQWVAQADMFHNVGQEATVAHPNGNIYVISGYTGSGQLDSLDIFNQAGNTWTKGSPIPYATRGASYTLGQDSMIYVFGGYASGDVDSCYKYNTKTDTWTSIAKLPTAVWYSAAITAPNGLIYVFGGENGQSLVQIYNPTLNTWSSGTAIPTPVKEHGAMLGNNGLMYIIGGLNGAGSLIDSVQVYDPTLDKWSRASHMPTSRCEFAYIKDDVNGMLYCIGGKTNGGNNSAPFLTVVEFYDVYSDMWFTGTPLPHGLGETAGASINNGINVFGGADSATTYSTHNYRMDILPTGTANGLGYGEGFNVYPNPSSGMVNIQVSSAKAEKLTIRIMDITGQIMYSNTWNDFSGEELKNVDMNGFSKGIYFIQYISDKSNVVRKQILQ